MDKTLLFMSTHFVDEAIISEYVKMLNTPNVDAILAMDNNAFKYDFTERIENKIFYGSSVKCFFFDSKLHDEMNLPYFAFKSDEKFGDVMWYNCDYILYYVRKFFPDYDYYWRFEYDVFCNAKTYEGFLKKFSDNRADLLIKDFRDEIKDRDWQGTQKVDWIYKDKKIYAGFFPVERISARAIDFLYKRRLEHAKIFHEDGGKNKWIHCELFAPTELMHNNFICCKLDEPHVQLKNISLNDDRIFLTPDDKLYHPVKSVKKELFKINGYVKDIVSMFGKIFFTTLINKLEDLNLKGLPHSMAPDFSYIIFPLATEEGGGGNTNCTTAHKLWAKQFLYR